MRFIPILMLAILLSIISMGQQKLTVKVSEEKSGQPIAGASILLKGSKEGVSADSLGRATIIIPMSGRISLTISAISYEEKQVILDLPVKEELLKVYLEPAENENETIVVKATRSSRTIVNIPTRIEIINGEELD